MSRAWRALAAAAVGGALAAGPAVSAEHPHGTFRVTNDAGRIVECVLLVDGREGVYGPLKLGVDYRFVDRDGHVDLVEGPAAP